MGWLLNLMGNTWWRITKSRFEVTVKSWVSNH